MNKRKNKNKKNNNGVNKNEENQDTVLENGESTIPSQDNISEQENLKKDDNSENGMNDQQNLEQTIKKIEKEPQIDKISDTITMKEEITYKEDSLKKDEFLEKQANHNIEKEGVITRTIEIPVEKQMKRISSLKRKPSIYKDVDFSETLLRPEFQISAKQLDMNEKIWELMGYYIPRDINSIQKSIVTHIEYTLARTRFDLDRFTLYQGTSLSVRDRLLEAWNDTQINIKINDPKRVYYLSIEFLLGRLLQNALINIDMEDNYRESLNELGYKLEEIYDKENDPALGNGGLGRLAACYLDSMTTLNIPAWGYGIRYDYGIFKQTIENLEQKELPDYWLTRGNPWEIMRIDIKYKVKFYGHCRDEIRNGKKVRVWDGGSEVDAIAFDTVIPGWSTFNCNTLRLWKSYPSEEFDFESFNKGDYSSALEERDHASYITSVLYPNDSNYAGKELRLKQQYFFCCATIQDLVRRFTRSGLPWSEFPNKNAIQLNDTHPAISITEMLRQLVDVFYLDYEEAFNIIRKTFAYTNHTVLPEALEKWPVDLFSNLLPRHMELIYLINHYFLEDARKRYPQDETRLARLSIIEESSPKLIRMANLCIICSHSVNGVAEIHSMLLKTSLFKDFNDIYPKKFLNITNGVTPRRWIHCAFPELSKIISCSYGNQDWLSELSLLENMYHNLEKSDQLNKFIESLKDAKLSAKRRLIHWVKEHTGQDIDETFMFDVQVKRIHEYKRQLMNAFYCIHRYLSIKAMTKQEKENLVKRVTFFGGKAAPGYMVAKNTIKVINMIANIVNNDPEVFPYFKIIFLPDYKVSAAQIIIPAADLSQHISTAGTEASGTSNMKFAMTGSLIIGTRDGANIEIAEQIGEDNIFFFGCDVNQVNNYRKDMGHGVRTKISDALRNVIHYILSGKTGDIAFFREYINNLINGSDYYLITKDFDDYVIAQQNVDNLYKNTDEWYKKTIKSFTQMGYFSSDRSIEDYCEKIWNVEPMEIVKPSSKSSERIISCGNLNKLPC